MKKKNKTKVKKNIRRSTTTMEDAVKQALSEQEIQEEELEAEETEEAQPEAGETEAAQPEEKEVEETEEAQPEEKEVEETEEAQPEAEETEAVQLEAKETEAVQLEEKEEEPEAKEAQPEEKEEEPEAKEAQSGETEEQKIFVRRLGKHHDELKWLYMELYGNDSMFAELTHQMYRFYMQRSPELRESDLKREADPDWYKKNDMLGMMLYVDNFAGTIKGVEEKLDYLEKCNVNYLHLMPFMDTPDENSDGGYAVSDFRKVKKELGTMEDLEHLTSACHKRGINVCADFVMNHTSDEHRWAKKAKSGDGEYMSRYFFFHDYSLPSQYERTVPQVFPTAAPGNFTWIPEAGHFVMTTFYPYQWDLNYKNPRVFNEMMYNFLYLVNRGIDVVRLDAIPYIWKELRTSCRNLLQVHTIVRMMRMISEIVCPGTLLLGEVVMEPEKVVPYFGTLEKPECHMLYNVTTMATTWHTVATRNIGLLRDQFHRLGQLPKQYVFLNYLRCHDDIGWGLDYDRLRQDGLDQVSHKKYLNNYFLGYEGYSNSRGELYNDDPVSKDARFCGTTASMCGIEKAEVEKDEEAMDRAVSLDVMLHAYLFMQSGIPVIYSGDEIGQTNDYSYEKDPRKACDSRYIHRGRLQWELAENIEDPQTPQGKLFQRLSVLENLRKEDKIFMTQADTWTLETGDNSILGLVREFEGEKLIGLFNFSEQDRTAWIKEEDGMYKDLVSGEVMEAKEVDIKAYDFFYLKRQK